MGSLQDHSQLSAAVKSFISSGANFESTTFVDSVIAETDAATDLMTVFALPLQHRLMSFDTALRWTMFLSVAPLKAIDLGDKPFSAHLPFSAGDALNIIAQVFDRGIQDCAYVHFDEDEDEDEDEVEEMD